LCGVGRLAAEVEGVGRSGCWLGLLNAENCAKQGIFIVEGERRLLLDACFV